jgi:hypothetical protein
MVIVQAPALWIDQIWLTTWSGRLRRGVGCWVSIEAVGDRLGLEPGPAIGLADDCELAGWVRHDRSHMGACERGRALPHSVTLSGKGWELIRAKAAPARGRGRQ